MDHATSELAQVVALAASIVGSVIYLQRAQMAAIERIVKLVRGDRSQPTVIKLDADQSGRFAELLGRAIDSRDDVRELGREVSALTGAMSADKRPTSPGKPPPTRDSG